MTDQERDQAMRRAIAEGKPPWHYIPKEDLPREDDHLIVREVVQRANEIRRREIEEN